MSLVTEGSHCRGSWRMLATVAFSLMSLWTFSAGNWPPSALMRVEYISSASRLG